MIPKIIHYCWFGGNGDGFGDEMLPNICTSRWRKKLDGYKIVRWDESNCNIHENPMIEKLYNEGKYAFVSDYFRLKVLYEHGGIYLDTDIYVNKPFDDFLHYDFFMGFIYNYILDTGIIGCCKRNKLVLLMLESFERNCGCINNGYLTESLHQSLPTLAFNGKTQFFEEENAIILNKSHFSAGKIVGTSHSIHLFDGSWWRKDKAAKDKHNKMKIRLLHTPLINLLAVVNHYNATKKYIKYKKKNKKS